MITATIIIHTYLKWKPAKNLFLNSSIVLCCRYPSHIKETSSNTFTVILHKLIASNKLSDFGAKLIPQLLKEFYDPHAESSEIQRKIRFIFRYYVTNSFRLTQLLLTMKKFIQYFYRKETDLFDDPMKQLSFAVKENIIKTNISPLGPFPHIAAMKFSPIDATESTPHVDQDNLSKIDFLSFLQDYLSLVANEQLLSETKTRLVAIVFELLIHQLNLRKMKDADVFLRYLN